MNKVASTGFFLGHTILISCLHLAIKQNEVMFKYKMWLWKALGFFKSCQIYDSWDQVPALFCANLASLAAK